MEEQRSGTAVPSREHDGVGSPPRRRRARRALRILAFALLGLVGALTAVLLGASRSGDVGPFAVTLSLRPSLRGGTVVQLAPLGSVHFDTHRGPFLLDVRVDEVRRDEAQRLLANPSLFVGIDDEISDDLRQLLVGLLVRAGLLGIAGGLALGLVASRRPGDVAVSVVAAAVLLTGAVGLAARTWRPSSIAEPQYTGLLALAPQVVGDVRDITQRFDEYGTQLADLVGNLAGLYEAVGNLPEFAVGPDTIVLLHVSDIHLNLAAYDLMREIVEQFDVDAVLDTGDSTDFGTSAENATLAPIASLGVPYVWIRGNHDSRSTQAAVARLTGTRVLDFDAVDVAGLRILGIGDPRFTPDKSEDTSADVQRAVVERFAPRVTAAVAAEPAGGVDILLVHDIRAAASVGGRVPLVLAGHEHRRRKVDLDGTLGLVEGSTGGAGMRGLGGDAPLPLECTVLYIDATTRRLQAFDAITVSGLGAMDARIERTVVPGEDVAAPTSPPSSAAR